MLGLGWGVGGVVVEAASGGRRGERMVDGMRSIYERSARAWIGDISIGRQL